MMADPDFRGAQSDIDREESSDASFHDIVPFLGLLAAILVAIVFLGLAYHSVQTVPRVEAVADSLTQQLRSMRATSNAAVAGAVGGSTQDTLGVATPPGSEQPAENEGPPDWLVKVIVAFGLLVCLGAWNTAMESLLIAVALLVLAGILYVISTKVIPHLKRKCRSKKKEGFWGWVLRFFCWLLIVLDWIIKVLAVLCFVVGMALLLWCGFKAFQAAGCIISLLPEAQALSGT